MKKTSLKTAVLVVAFVCFGITFSNAQLKRERPKNPPTFSKVVTELDKNDDGKLSLSEVKGPLKEMFADTDTNEDGFITEEEFEKMPKPEKRERRSN